MTSYLLLRNNKESGPFTLDQLVSLGLKAYDLVWVNGKSAAWRYPGEIKELEDYAPPVEEQPFDRFYKKPSEVKEVEQPVEIKAAIKANEKDNQPLYKSSKSVFVTLPGNTKKRSDPVISNQQEDPYQKYQPNYQQNQEPVVAKTITITENPVAAEVKYSQPLDEIKEMYVKTLMDRKQKMASKAILLEWGKKAAVVIAIIAIGVVIGFAMKSGSSKNDITENNQAPIVNPPLINDIAAEENSVENNQSLIQEEQTNIPQVQIEKEKDELSVYDQLAEEAINAKKQQPIQNEGIIANKRTKNTVNAENQDASPVVQQPYEAAEVNARTGERTRKVRDNNPVADEITSTYEKPVEQKTKTVAKSGSLSKLVNVSSNDYTVVAFGGIRNLQLTVTNDSKFELDNVTVELQYLKPSEQPLKTENIQFRSISPGGSSTIKIPDTNRGIKVSYKITNILSTQSSKEFADL